MCVVELAVHLQVREALARHQQYFPDTGERLEGGRHFLCGRAFGQQAYRDRTQDRVRFDASAQPYVATAVATISLSD